VSETQIVWCHGSLSTPWGAKSHALAETARRLKLNMTAPDFRGQDDPEQRVKTLHQYLRKNGGPAILVGSSMGGYVAASVARFADVRALFLLAPAFGLPGYSTRNLTNLPQRIAVIHGWSDEVVPVDSALHFAREHRAEMHLLDDGHRLENSIGMLCFLFERFLKSTLF